MKKIIAASIILLVVITLCGCGSSQKGILGSWAYNYEPEREILYLGSKGDAVYNGDEYTYNTDDAFIYLSSPDGSETKLRYSFDGKNMFLFTTTQYEYAGDGKPDGIIGSWLCADKNWSFEFTSDGEFSEDGYFTGSYSVDDKTGTFTLDYHESFEKTTCYYNLNSSSLTVEYPWKMERTEK